MSLLPLLRRLRGSIRTSSFERAMEAELRHHLEFEAAALTARGMDPAAELGIGANTAIFSVVNAVLMRPLPYTNGDRLIELRHQQPLAGIENVGVSVKEIADYRAQTAALDAVVEYHQMSFNLSRSSPSRSTS